MEINPIYLYYFYNSIILYFEKRIKPNPTGLRITDPYMKAILLANNIYPICIEKHSRIQSPDSFESSGETFIILKVKSRNSILYSIIEHLRNGFAHGNFSIKNYNNEDYVCIKDSAVKGEASLSMVAQMPLRVLVCLVESIKAIKAKQQP